MLDHREDCHVGHRANHLADDAHEFLTGVWAEENIPWIKPCLPDRLHRRFVAWSDRHDTDVDGWWTRHAWTVAIATTFAVWVGIGLALGWAL